MDWSSSQSYYNDAHKESKLSLYQRSGKPTFIFGGLEKNQGFLKLFYPYECTRMGSFTLNNHYESGGYYHRKADRSYIQTLDTPFLMIHSFDDYERSLEDLFRSVKLDKTKEEGLLSLPKVKLQDHIRQAGRKLLLEPTTPTQEELLDEQYLSKKELLESRLSQSTFPEEIIDAARDLYMVTVKSAVEGSKIAKLSISIAEVSLWNKFASVKEKLSKEQKIVFLKDIKNLLDQNFKSISSEVSAVYYLCTLELGAALFESAQADMAGDSTENRLREAMVCFEYALENYKNTDSDTHQSEWSLKNNLGVSKCTLGWFLRSKILPQTKPEEFTEQDIDILWESYTLIKAAKELSFESDRQLEVITSDLKDLRNIALSSKPLQQRTKEKLLNLAIFDESTVQESSIIPFETHFTQSLSIADKQEASVPTVTSSSHDNQNFDINTDQSADELYQQGLRYRDGKVEGYLKDSTQALDRALNIFTTLSKKGHVKAMHNRASIYYKRGEYIKAYIWFENAAKKGLQQSASNLQKMLHDPKVYKIIKDHIESTPPAYKRQDIPVELESLISEVRCGTTNSGIFSEFFKEYPQYKSSEYIDYYCEIINDKNLNNYLKIQMVKLFPDKNLIKCLLLQDPNLYMADYEELFLQLLSNQEFIVNEGEEFILKLSSKLGREKSWVRKYLYKQIIASKAFGIDQLVDFLIKDMKTWEGYYVIVSEISPLLKDYPCYVTSNHGHRILENIPKTVFSYEEFKEKLGL